MKTKTLVIVGAMLAFAGLAMPVNAADLTVDKDVACATGVGGTNVICGWSEATTVDGTGGVGIAGDGGAYSDTFLLVRAESQTSHWGEEGCAQADGDCEWQSGAPTSITGLDPGDTVTVWVNTIGCGGAEAQGGSVDWLCASDAYAEATGTAV